MKNMKKIIFVSLFSLILIFGVNNVQAKEKYSSYNKGDKITVNVNDNDKLDFYVIENSGSDSDKVTAIYESTLGDPITYKPGTDGYEGSSVQKKLNELTNSWSNVISKRLLKADEVIPGITDVELKKLTVEKFEEPSYLFSVKEYWVSDCLIEDKAIYTFTVECFSEAVGFGVLGVAIFDEYNEEEPSTANIRPVITVSKKYVDGGVIIPEEDKIWKEFIEKFKNSDAVSQFIDDGYTVVFDYDDDYLNIKLTDTEKNKTWTTSFEYADGIINYVPNTDNENLFLDSNYWIPNTLFVLSEMKGYDIDKLIFWLDDKDNLTLINDGIEFNFKEIKITQNNQFVTGSITFDGVTSYKLDIKNGIKTYKVDNDFSSVESDEITTNPKTGSFIIIGITALVCILSFGLCLYFTNKKIKQV